MKKFLLLLLFAAAPPLLASDDHNPIGVTGAFEGVITTGCAYNVLNHNARRQIDDIVVPGSIGKYPLKMTRYYNSRGSGYGILGTGWTHGYGWGWYPPNTASVIGYPNGDKQDATCEAPVGVSDGWESQSYPYAGDFRLADGGKVHFDTTNGYTHPTTITDPHGQPTSLTYDTSGRLTRVTEPAGRYLQFIYTTINGYQALTEVDAYDGQGNQVDHVVYHYTAIKPKGNGTQGNAVNCLTSVDYSDGTHAYYTYQDDNAPDSPNQPCPCSVKIFPVLKTCKDVRYTGPMRNIYYEYQDNGPHGAITKENYWDGVSGHEGTGPMLSKTLPLAPSPLISDVIFDTTYTEYRGDGPTRVFNYTTLHLGRNPEDTCPTWYTSPAPSQFLLNYTDFQGHTTVLGYDANWYINSVKDANNNTTSYTRGPPPNAYPGTRGIGQIITITYPGGAHVDYGYHDESPNISGHYVRTVSDERQKVTTYTRDPSTFLITRIDYPSDATTPVSNETFTYNNFGQVLTHQLRNGSWESFAYNPRGLLTDKYNPKSTLPGGSDPHTHYDYYTAADGKLGWIDRVKKVTLPANWRDYAASETYEYERTFDANGVTNLNGGAVAGRGLPTKVTHGDAKYQTFKYDWYGNKAWQDDELRNATSYTYDDYNRRLTITEPSTPAAQYTYVPTNGNGTSPYLHTTNNPDTITTPAGIVSKNVYDENFRKESTTAAYGTASAATTSFNYDNVGNLAQITDPLNRITVNAYDTRNRKTSTTEASGTSLQRTTTWHYDNASNIYQIDRPDTTQETKSYDAVNRVLTDTVPKTASPVVNIVTTFSYNPSGTINSVKDAENRYTYFTYDASDRKTMMTYPNNSTQQWAYDDAGNLELRTTAGGQQEAFFYDTRNFLYATWWNTDWNNSIVDWRFFDHDATGKLTEAENGTNGWNTNIISDVHRYYDAAGHLTQEQQIITGLGTKTVNYPNYDGDGRSTRMYVTGATGYDFTYSYDAMGRFEKISLTNSSVLFQYFYDAASNEKERDNLLNGVNQLTPRDALNRMTSWDAKTSNSTLAHEGYTYDPMNRITVVDWANGHTDSFNYYLDGELQVANLGNFGHNITYNIDRMGNRTSVVDNTVTSTYSAPNAINQYYPTAAGSSITNGPEHEIQTYNGVTYTYINDERLKSANTGNTIYWMTYDALGRCVQRTLNGGGQDSMRPVPTPHGSPTPPPRPSPTPTPVPDAVTTYYVYDGEKPILEYDSSGVSVGTNVYGKGVDEILERVAFGSDNQSYTYFLQQNHEGSVTLLTDINGDVLERYRYDAFGAPTIYTGTWGTISSTMYDNRFLFTGREYAATYRSTYTTPLFNFYEYRARAYNPTLGRFMSEDPKLFDAGDYNLFRYCHNDPVDMTDPMGLEVGFGESLIPVWGSGHMAYDAFNEGHYAMAAFHTAMAITDVSGVKALGSIAAKAALKGAAKAAAERAAIKVAQKTAAEKEGGLVIGKLKDVGKADGWRTGDHTANLPDRGSTKANWQQNSSELRAAESNGKPIRDVSSDANGNLRDNSGFLKAERNLLENRGRIYDSKTNSWIKPEQPKPVDFPPTESH